MFSESLQWAPPGWTRTVILTIRLSHVVVVFGTEQYLQIGSPVMTSVYIGSSQLSLQSGHETCKQPRAASTRCDGKATDGRCAGRGETRTASPRGYPSDLHSTVAAVSSHPPFLLQIVPHRPLCLTSTRPSFGVKPPCSRTGQSKNCPVLSCSGPPENSPPQTLLSPPSTLCSSCPSAGP